MLILYPHLHAEQQDQGTLTRQRHSAWPVASLSLWSISQHCQCTGSTTQILAPSSARLRPPYRCKSYLVNTRHLQAWRDKEARGWANSCFTRC